MRLFLVPALLLLFSAATADENVAEPAGSTDPSAIRNGFFKIALTPLELLGERGAASIAEVFAADDALEWAMYVPPGYEASRPAGAIVYISPHESGGPPVSWNDGLRDANLIWIGAQHAGNDLPTRKRMFLAMFAPLVLQRRYALDANRVYLAGFSGGAKTASRVAILRANMFKGGIFMSGALHWGSDTPALLNDVSKLRYVFISGTNDSALKDVKRVHNKFKLAGIDGARLIIIGNHRHVLPEASYFMQAVDYLDSRQADGTADTGKME